jgi:hypothetical protein
MQKLNDLSRSLTPLKPDGTLIAVIEMSLSSWLVAGIVPGVERQPSKKLEVDENALLKLLNRWREEAHKAGQGIERIAVAFEAGRDGFWLARWLRARDIEASLPAVLRKRNRGIEETSASFEARSAPRFYPTKGDERGVRMLQCTCPVVQASERRAPFRFRR